MKKINLPNVTGYLIIGLLIGPYCLGIFSHETISIFSIIPDIALGFIAFSIGAEFNLSYLKKVGKSPIIISTIQGFGVAIFVTLVLVITGNDFSFSLLLGAIASATAPAATLMVIRQYKAKGPVTSMLLPVVAIDDAIAIMAFSISAAIANALNSPEGLSFANAVVNPLTEILGAMLFGAVLGLIMTLLTKWFTGRGNRLSVVIVFILIGVGVSNSLGLSSLMTCMTMSALYVNISNVSDKVFEQVDRFTPPLFMLFFFISGADLDISVIPTVGLVGLLYILARAIGKILGTYLGAEVAKAEPVIKKYLGLTMLPQAGVAIGLSAIAMDVVPQYGVAIRTIVLSATVIYELTGPVITKLALKKAGEIK
ncbi:MAG TPA: cation:proton antiporter [Clostridiales bacterium]|nr:cation:proton antiporter [Clostridiales bacterium]